MILRFMASPSAYSLRFVDQHDQRFAVAMDFSFAVARNDAAQERECKDCGLHVAAVSPATCIQRRRAGGSTSAASRCSGTWLSF